jgi:RNA polymerase sigma-70 factor (ECF subfamily)
MPETLENIAINHSQSLILRAKKGDEKAFSKLVGLWFKRIYNFSLKYFGDHDMAMEATQKTFIAIYKNVKRLKDPDSFRYWIYKIALNQCREEDRKNKQRPWHSIFNNREAQEIEETSHHPEKEFQKTEKEELLGEMLMRLPEEQRLIVIMKEYEGMKFREIAMALEISENTAKSRLYYGLKGLRKMIEKSELNLKPNL